MGVLSALVGGLTAAAKAAYNTSQKKSSSSGSSSNSNKSNNSTSNSSKATEAYTQAANNSSNGYTAKSDHFDATAKNTNSAIYDAIAEQGRLYNEAKAAGDTAGMEKAHAAAEAYRTSLGYSGGEDGSEYIPTSQNTVQVPTYIANEDDYYKWEDIQERYDKLNDDIAKKQEQAVKQGTARLEAQKVNANQGYDDASRQAYIAYMQNKRALPQQLASSGLTGGETETSNIMLNSNYENNINDIAIQRQNAMNELDNAIIDLKNSGDLSTAEQVLANNQQALNAYQNYLNNKTSYNQWATTHNANRYDTSVDQTYRGTAYKDSMAQQALQNQRYDEEVERQKEETRRQYILNLYANGQMTREEAAKELNVSPESLYDQMAYTTQANQLGLKATQANINNTYSTIANRNKAAEEEEAQKKLANQYYNLANIINSSSGGVGVIIDNPNGGYMINPELDKASYIDPIIARAMDQADAGKISTDEGKNFLYSLGILQSDIDRVASYYKQ